MEITSDQIKLRQQNYYTLIAKGDIDLLANAKTKVKLLGVEKLKLIRL
jgi:hypothetical protein